MDFPLARDEQLIDAIVADQCVINAREASKAVHMLEFVDLRRAEGERRGGRKLGDSEATAAMFELSLALVLPVATIQLHVARARSIRSRMPAVWQAWLGGAITQRSVWLIDETCDRLTHADSRTRLDEQVVPVASSKTLGQLRTWLNRFVERVEAESALERHHRSLKNRGAWIKPDVDGMAWMTALMSITDASSIDARLDAMARACGAADERTMDQRRADILADLLLGRATNGYRPGSCDGTPAAPPATIGVIVPVQSLVGLGEAPGELADRSASVPAELIRSMAVQPGTLFWRLLTDERGNLLDASQLGRYPSAELGFAIRLRDGTSVFPTSSVPASRCDIDHSIAHCGERHCTEHGPTTAKQSGSPGQTDPPAEDGRSPPPSTNRARPVRMDHQDRAHIHASRRAAARRIMGQRVRIPRAGATGERCGTSRLSMCGETPPDHRRSWTVGFNRSIPPPESLARSLHAH